MPLGESLQDCVCWVSHEDQRLVSPVVRPLLPTTSDFCHIAQSRGFGSISYYCMAPLAAVPEPWWLWARELVVVKHRKLPKELEHSAIIQLASDSDPRAHLRETREALEDLADRTKEIQAEVVRVGGLLGTDSLLCMLLLLCALFSFVARFLFAKMCCYVS